MNVIVEDSLDTIYYANKVIFWNKCYFERIKVFGMGIFTPGYVIGLGVNVCLVFPVL